MNWRMEIKRNGFIRTAKEQKRVYYKKKEKIPDEENIDICLNCTRKNCNGSCKNIRRKNNGI